MAARSRPARTRLVRPAAAVPCPQPGCGEVDAGGIADAAGLPSPRVPDGWIYVLVRSSTLPGRWFCSATCAHRGIALAELRLAAVPPKN